MYRALLLLAVIAGSSGCAVHERHDNAARLMARPDFQQARCAAPEWCRDALKTVNALEHSLERK